MDIQKTVIFIDGQNFKKDLQKYRFKAAGHNLPEYRLDEKHFHWEEFFRQAILSISEQTRIPHRLLRVYWYNTQATTPLHRYDRAVRDIVDQYHDQFPDLLPSVVESLAQRWHQHQRDLLSRAKEEVFDDIQKRTSFLEFKYVGQLVLRPYKVKEIVRDRDREGSFLYQGTVEGEKGVDIGITIDMISKMAHYDAAVLISGDTDFVPLIQYLKDALKLVYSLSLSRGEPGQIQLFSPQIKNAVDYFHVVPEKEMLGRYLDRKSGIPPIILSEIDRRLEELSGEKEKS
ncbi:MAG: NYN domain-containing protein [Nitrospiraceae bacterium]|nr:NYN domain-containing protein [Nitrospiraceae bacterium]